VQCASHIGRGNHDAIGGIIVASGGKVAARFPDGIPMLFNCVRGVGFFHEALIRIALGELQPIIAKWC